VERLSSLESAEDIAASDDKPVRRKGQSAEQEQKHDPIRAEGPQLPTGKTDTLCDQDDVDDLLSSLGF